MVARESGMKRCNDVPQWRTLEPGTALPDRLGRRVDLHPDRALPADATARDLARTIYRAVRDLPLVSMHGHVDAAVLRADEPFGNPAELFVIPDHYLVRMLVSQGGR